MTKSIHLQSIGQHPAIEAKKAKIGDYFVWNWGYKTEILAIVKETPKTIVFLLAPSDLSSGSEPTERRMHKSRMVAYLTKEQVKKQKESVNRILEQVNKKK